MKNLDFKEFLFKSAFMAMACDGNIDELEIQELKNLVANEIYFMEYDYKEALENNVKLVKQKGRKAINDYLGEISKNDLNEHQELLLIEVLLRIIKADSKIEESELEFLHLAKSKLKIDEQSIIVQFPHHIEYLLDNKGFGNQLEFTNEISL
jgi:uncharacterized tellurite resistance protein B-like protein